MDIGKNMCYGEKINNKKKRKSYLCECSKEKKSSYDGGHSKQDCYQNLHLS